MMKRLLCLCLLCTLFWGCSGCAAAQGGDAAASSPKTALVTDTVHESTGSSSNEVYLANVKIKSEAIADNLMNTSSEKTLWVYLPPSYYSSGGDYPVVYYLHGYGEPVGRYLTPNLNNLDEAFEGGASEFIMVEIQGDTSFYVNSPVTGNWEDYVIDEVIPFIDQTYNTIPDSASRGICGMSMGGFGAINLALRHPDVFCAVYAMSPGLFDENGLTEAMGLWNQSFRNSYARAFAPDPDAESLGQIPVFDGSEADNAIVEKWENGFGNLQGKLEAYLSLNTPLKGIGFSYGTKDSYTWIPKGTQYFSDMLADHGIENTLFVFEGGHYQPTDSIQQHIIPFFNEYLTY